MLKIKVNLTINILYIQTVKAILLCILLSEKRTFGACHSRTSGKAEILPTIDIPIAIFFVVFAKLLYTTFISQSCAYLLPAVLNFQTIRIVLGNADNLGNLYAQATDPIFMCP